MSFWSPREIAVLALCSFVVFVPARAANAAEHEQGLLDILLENGAITRQQYDSLIGKDDLTAEDLGQATESEPLPAPATVPVEEISVAESGEGPEDEDQRISEKVANAVARKIEEEFPVKASYGSKGFRLETRDGNWQTNLQWRAQLRLTWPTSGDPRQVDNFASEEEITFEARRLRMKIGGHGYRPWLKYYFEVDLQPSRDSDDSSASGSARVIDWRIDLAKYEKLQLRVGQWKIDYNRERVDSSGRQAFVERSIVNRIFTIDRQVGVSLRGRLFAGTHADLRYYMGVFTGEGRGVRNDDNNMMYVGRLQWNFLGRDLDLRQTDVERTERPTASLAFGGATTTSKCTRWSSGGCGNLDGFTDVDEAEQGQFRVHQAVQELAFKWQGYALQQELHWKRVVDRSFTDDDARQETDLYGLYAQHGYFFHEVFEWVPEELELGFRYGLVREPNEIDRLKTNTRQEFTTAANWFFHGHDNKLTLDYSYLTLDDDVLARNVDDHRVRFQWDISF